MMRYWLPIACLIALSLNGGSVVAQPAKLKPNIRGIMKPVLPVPKCEQGAQSNGWGAGQVDAKAAVDIAFDAFEKSCYKEAIRLAETEAVNSGPSNTLLGLIYEQGYGVPQDMNKAADWYLRGAQLGDKYSQFAIGVMLAEGRGVKENKKQAAQFFEMAAAQNHATALYNLAMLYVEGNGKPQDLVKAAELLERSAKLENVAAEYDLAALYQQGRGVRKDERVAAYWLGKAAESGMTNAELEFGIALYLGKGVEQNEPLAFAMIRRAAEKGNPVAQNRLAHAFAGGRGTTPDKVEAAKWHLLARGAGVSDFGLDKYLASLSREERTKAEAGVYDWQQATAALLD